ncbi:MAG: bifunctional hydroxymethylpyrimidine kinase/phosphomethylpyrimidine kinase [Kiritimatiellia bacterium]
MNSDDITLKTRRQNVALTIAGSDSGGNAGIQADLRAFHSLGVHGCTVITALTAQNPFSVNSILTADGDFVTEQLNAVLGVYDIRVLKTGMLCSAEIVEAVANTLTCHNRILKVIDPVIIATSGAHLLEDDAITAFKRDLLSLADLITPNLPEAEELLGKTLDSDQKLADGAREFFEIYGCAALIKGGHVLEFKARDLLFDGENTLWFESPRIEDPLSTHGTGCSLSAAIAASLANGKELHEAIQEGKAYVYESIRTGVGVGECATVLGTPTNIPINKIQIKNFAL